MLSSVTKASKLLINLISESYYDLEELLLGLLSRLIQNDKAVSRIYSKIIYEQGSFIAERGTLLYLKYDNLKWVVRKIFTRILSLVPYFVLWGSLISAGHGLGSI